MSGKKITIGSRPTKVSGSADLWVRNDQAKKMKRITFEVPDDLHRTFKMQCAAQGANMADVLREQIELLVKNK